MNLSQRVFSQKVQTKILLQALTIEIVLVLRTLYVWLWTWLWGLKNAWIWALFMFLYELASEIFPFLVFCYILIKQVRYFNKLINRNSTAMSQPWDVN